MPTTYTHDLFGKKVYRQLPEEIRKVIRENGNLFRIGLHGPDILFYDLFNQKVCGLGTEMHKIPCSFVFFKRDEHCKKNRRREASGLSSGICLSLSSGQLLSSFCG